MYIIPEAKDQSPHVGLRGFSESNDHQGSIDAILRALRLNPVGGYVKESAPRKELDAAFESVPPCSALELAQKLDKSQGSLEKLFRYRLHPFTQGAMIQILVRKAEECQQQGREKVRRLEARQRLMGQLRQQLCTQLAERNRILEEVCKRIGEGSDQCRKLRASAHRDRQELSTQGIRCAIRSGPAR